MNAQAFLLSSSEAALVYKAAAAPDRRQPVHLIFVVDVSDSMSDGNKLYNVRRSIEFLLPYLTDADRMSVITFGEGSQVLIQCLAPTDLVIREKMAKLRTDGCTNMSAGLMSVRDVVEIPGVAAADAPVRKQGVLLLTDGHANRGVADAPGLKRIVEGLLNDFPGLTLATFGYGADHNTELLSDMATSGSGSYNVVYNLENVATTFGEVLGGLTTVVAQNFTLTLPPGTEPLTGYKVSAVDGEPVRVQIGDVYAENEVVVLFRLFVPTDEVGPEAIRPVITYHDMLSLRSVSQALQLAPVPAEIPKNVEQAQFRYKVSQLLKRCANGITRELKEQAEALLAQLKELTYVDEQLIQMMIDDLETLLEAFDAAAAAPWNRNAAGGMGPVPLMRSTTSQMAQHSAYLSLGRGLRSQAPAPEDPVYAPASIPRAVRFAGGGGGGPAPLGRSSSMAQHWGSDPDSGDEAEAEAASPVARSATPPPGAAPPGAPPLAPTPSSRVRTAHVDADASPFMNQRQRIITQTLRATSSQAP